MDGQVSFLHVPNGVSTGHAASRSNATNDYPRNDLEPVALRDSYQALPPPIVIDTTITDIQPFVNHHRTSPADLPTLFYERYDLPNPWNLWDQNAGLQTTSSIVGVPLDQNFFRESIIKHLSFPLHEPWLFSPYISVTGNPQHINKYNPLSLYQFNIRHTVLAINLSRHRWSRWVYRVNDLIVALELPASVYDHRPGWMDEYLVLQSVPRDAIRVYTPEQFEQAFLGNARSAPMSPIDMTIR